MIERHKGPTYYRFRRLKSLLYWGRHPGRWLRYVEAQSALYGPLAIFGIRADPDMAAYCKLRPGIAK